MKASTMGDYLVSLVYFIIVTVYRNFTQAENYWFVCKQNDV